MCSPTGRAAPASAASPPAGTRSLAGLFTPGMPGPVPATPQRPLTADEASEAEEKLARLCREFPDFRIWREIICDRASYIARSIHFGTNPHTVVTHNLDELGNTLSDAHAAQPTGARSQ
jgi:hypothetical protein